jgi:hypothetical protein
MNQLNILQVLHKNYEERSIREHKLIAHTISSCFPTHSEEKVKMLTYYIEVREGPATIHSH